jgi:hypothetical protein
MRYIIFILFFQICSAGIFAQTGKVSGYVYDELGRPLKDANVFIWQLKAGTTTDSTGFYTITLPSGKYLSLEYSYTGFRPDFRNITLKSDESRLITVHLNSSTLDTFNVVGKGNRLESMNSIDAKMFPSGMGGFEDIIKSGGLGVSSNNEMSSAYSVRGGNFDENLVYINNIEVYRPFLARSGQQEGLSFINSDLIDNIYFSSGGFAAKYGDKMSSVLDITYTKPLSNKGSASLSLMGGSFHFEGLHKSRFTYLTGFRYRSNSYLLNSLPTKGAYKPVFMDFQTLLTYMLREEWKLSFFGYYGDNKYRFVPETRETDFGTVNEALRLTVYFEGQEITQFKTMMGATTLSYESEDSVSWHFIGSAFRTLETESYDILGAYRLDELEKDLGSENFGEIAFTRGIGSFINHSRNKLDAVVYNFSVIGSAKYRKALLEWGTNILTTS